MNLLPNSKQWKNWTLPSKLTAIGTLCGLMSIGVIILEHTYNISKYLISKNDSIAVNVQLDFKYSDKNGILVKGNPILLITNIQINQISTLMADVDMYSFDKGLSKVATYAKLGTYTHDHLIFESKVVPGQTIDHELMGLKGWNHTVLYIIRVQMYMDNSNTPHFQEHYLIIESNETEKSKSFREVKGEELNRIKTIISSFNKRHN